jgi:hypothetical protein
MNSTGLRTKYTSFCRDKSPPPERERGKKKNVRKQGKEKKGKKKRKKREEKSLAGFQMQS